MSNQTNTEHTISRAKINKAIDLLDLAVQYTEQTLAYDTLVKVLELLEDSLGETTSTQRLSTDKAAFIDTDYKWQKITADSPRGVKLQLINKRFGVASYGRLYGEESYYTHWAPLPTFKKELDIQLELPTLETNTDREY